jgi:hypothetical protein
MLFCVSIGHLSRGDSSAWSPWPSHQVKPSSISHIRHLASIPGKLRLWWQDWGVLLPLSAALVFKSLSRSLLEV